jgi:uncharacterized protein (DUF1810 family)
MSEDRFNLGRFVEAQRGAYERALLELRAGRKTGHWIWYVFPQLRGLGSSEASRFYGLSGAEEARAYLAHPVLGPRLRDCVEATLGCGEADPEEIFGALDAMKFRSSMTLFSLAAPEAGIFPRALEAFFAGEQDPRTVEMLRPRGA